ncbi:unnamed protein product [Darwinula stevensoni]|uniref:Major facilitator superfamily (MFS) profile domain-containing protein n=1 Tax=Darwinula stevensoni TaxID=69355 RepID=A0A7R9A8R9_9CRUS|nr:unnamed protein product [Darwinula stevensoni]CAG0896722.1 unnamed protein product [Darwinula stevensoni]
MIGEVTLTRPRYTQLRSERVMALGPMCMSHPLPTPRLSLQGYIKPNLGVLTTRWSIVQSPWLAFVTYGFMFGLGIGTAYMAPLSCGMRWFPENKGLVNGIIVGGFGLGAFIFNFAHTAYLNPENKVVSSSGYFTDEDILNRVPSLFLIMGGTYAVIQVIGCLLLKNPPQHFEQEREGIRVKNHQNYGTIMEPGNNEVDGVIDLLSLSEEDSSLSPSQVLRTRELWMLWLTFFFNQQAVGYISTMYKPFGQTFISNDRYLSVVGAIAALFNSFGRIFWGKLMDDTSYKLAMTMVTGLLMAEFFSLLATSLGGELMFTIWIFAIYATFCGTFVLLPTVTYQTFGPTYASLNYGIVFSNTVFSAPLTSILTQYLSEDFGWFGIFCLLAGFAFLSVLLTYFYPDNPSPQLIRGRMSET